MTRNRGFTLIELLIVVAIIAILAAIAVPNFLEAQTRSRVARVYADMRALTSAIEAYRVDNHRYPPPSIPANMYVGYYVLTSPIAYATNLPPDPFRPPDDIYGQAYRWRRVPDDYEGNIANYIPGYTNPVNDYYRSTTIAWMLRSIGPDRETNFWDYPPYDPTNGTLSRGEISRWGP